MARGIILILIIVFIVVDVMRKRKRNIELLCVPHVHISKPIRDIFVPRDGTNPGKPFCHIGMPRP